MFKTLSGRLAAIILLVFIIQLIAFLISVFSHNGFGALVNFIQYAPVTAVIGLIFGCIGINKEEGPGKLISIITMTVSIIYACISLFIIFGYSFGG